MITAFALMALLTGAPSAVAAPPPIIRLTLSNDRHLNPGDPAHVQVITDDDGYITVFNVDTDGRVRVLFPLDPGDDNFVRGGHRYELRGRTGREAFTADDQNGRGFLYAAYSRTPTDFTAYTAGDHWDYRALAPKPLAEDPEAELNALAQNMMKGRFQYDLLSYDVGTPQVASASNAFSSGPTSYGTGYNNDPQPGANTQSPLCDPASYGSLGCNQSGYGFYSSDQYSQYNYDNAGYVGYNDAYGYGNYGYGYGAYGYGYPAYGYGYGYYPGSYFGLSFGGFGFGFGYPYYGYYSPWYGRPWYGGYRGYYGIGIGIGIGGGWNHGYYGGGLRGGGVSYPHGGYTSGGQHVFPGAGSSYANGGGFSQVDAKRGSGRTWGNGVASTPASFAGPGRSATASVAAANSSAPRGFDYNRASTRQMVTGAPVNTNGTAGQAVRARDFSSDRAPSNNNSARASGNGQARGGYGGGYDPSLGRVRYAGAPDRPSNSQAVRASDNVAGGAGGGRNFGGASMQAPREFSQPQRSFAQPQMQSQHFESRPMQQAAPRMGGGGSFGGGGGSFHGGGGGGGSFHGGGGGGGGHHR